MSWSRTETLNLHIASDSQHAMTQVPVAARAIATSNSPPTEDALGLWLPTRILGRTGEHVTMLGLGGAHIGHMNEGDAHASIELAIREGIRFFDSAHQYYDGVSEERLGIFNRSMQHSPH